MTLQTHFSRAGVGSTLAEFLQRVPLGAELYWLTYSFSPPSELLTLLERRSITARFVCCHPDNGPTITKNTWDRIQAAPYASAYTLRDEPLALDEADVERIGLLHSKVIVWRETRRNTYGLATGSFNASEYAWNRNAEVVVLHRRREEAVDAWDYAQAIYERAKPLAQADIGSAAFRHAQAVTSEQWRYQDLGRIEGSSRGKRRRRIEEAKPRPSVQSPDAVAAFADALDVMLSNYPNDGDTIQWELYCALAERSARSSGRRDILYIPVGVGKTFIALRWLCDHLAGKVDGYAVYLVPNRWVQQTVLGHIATVARRAEIDSGEIEQWIRVVRPSEPYALDYVAHALVADECHNWNENGGEEKTYTHGFGECIQGQRVPVLGLSATPCRMEKACFNVAHFIQSFVGRKLEGDESEPSLCIAQARELGLICEAACVRLLEHEPEVERAIESVLTKDDGQLVGMGDYSSATLRHVWDILAEDPQALAQRVLELLGHYERKRAAVFLPPVGEHTDAFVEALMDWSPGPVFDFRARSADTGQRVFRGFSEAEADPEAAPILVTIDRFGEGVSVDDLDALVMLRATLSPRVAVQALGRGLRTAKGTGKDYCLVIDGVLFRERVEMFEQGAMTAISAPWLELDDWDDDELVDDDDDDLDDDDLDDDNDDIDRELDDDVLWEALTEPRILSTIRSSLREKGCKRVPHNDKLSAYIVDLRREDEPSFAEFTPAKLATAIRSERVRHELADRLYASGYEISAAIQALELPGSRRSSRAKVPNREQLLEQLQDYLESEFAEAKVRWEHNARGQDCMVLPNSLQVVRVYHTQTRGSDLRLAVRASNRHDYETYVIASADDFEEVRDAIVATGRVD